MERIDNIKCATFETFLISFHFASNDSLWKLQSDVKLYILSEQFSLLEHWECSTGIKTYFSCKKHNPLISHFYKNHFMGKFHAIVWIAVFQIIMAIDVFHLKPFEEFYDFKLMGGNCYKLFTIYLTKERIFFKYLI